MKHNMGSALSTEFLYIVLRIPQAGGLESLGTPLAQSPRIAYLR